MGPLAHSARRRGRRPKTNPLRAVAYIRVSTDRQELGPHAQREAIDRYAAQHGLELVSVHVETVSGAAPLDERPELLAALTGAREARAGVLLVAKRDRLARDNMVSLYLERELAADGIAIHSADGAANGSTAEAQLMRGILGSLAEYERALIRARTKAALAALKSRGMRTGSIPYGYRLAPDGRTLVEHANEAAIATRVRSEREQGASYREIAEGLERDRVQPRGERWHATTIARICAGVRKPRAAERRAAATHVG